MLVESVTLIVREVMRSTGSSVPSTLMPSTDEVPVSCGAPLTQRAGASARSARRLTRSPLKVGQQRLATAADVDRPDARDGLRPGQLAESGGWSGIGRPAIRS